VGQCRNEPRGTPTPIDDVGEMPVIVAECAHPDGPDRLVRMMSHFPDAGKDTQTMNAGARDKFFAMRKRA